MIVKLCDKLYLDMTSVAMISFSKGSKYYEVKVLLKNNTCEYIKITEEEFQWFKSNFEKYSQNDEKKYRDTIQCEIEELKGELQEELKK